jgi:hypothetical protein
LITVSTMHTNTHQPRYQHGAGRAKHHAGSGQCSESASARERKPLVVFTVFKRRYACLNKIKAAFGYALLSQLQTKEKVCYHQI